MKYTDGPPAPTLHGCMAAGAISLSLPFSPFKRTRYLPSEETIIATNGHITNGERFCKVGITALVPEVVKPTLLNKNCSNQKINASLLF